MGIPSELTQSTNTSKIVAFIMFLMIPLIYFFLGKGLGNLEGFATANDNYSVLAETTNTQKSEVDLGGPNIVLDAGANMAQKGILKLANGWKAKKVTSYAWNTNYLDTKQNVSIVKDDYEVIITPLNNYQGTCDFKSGTGSVENFKDRDGNTYIRVKKNNEFLVCVLSGTSTYIPLTSYGIITYKIPGTNPDNTSLNEMDTMIASLKKLP